MKFVHLTPQTKITRIKKDGIRSGRGRRGSGVYAVPLMHFGRVVMTEDQKVLTASPRSASTLWRWVAKSRHRNIAAIIFHTTPGQWPADLYVEIKATIGVDWLTDFDPSEIVIQPEDVRFLREAHDEGFCADLKLSIQTPVALGRCLQVLGQKGFVTWDRYDESIEIVFAKPIPPHQIERIVPLYRTNAHFKKAREHAQKDKES